jgi:hypothetical protein
MSLFGDLILGSSSLGSPPLSDIDNLSYATPAKVFHRWNMQTAVTWTTNDTKTLFTYDIPASITGDCIINFFVTYLCICTAGTRAGSVAARRSVIFSNREAGTLKTPTSAPGSTELSYIDVGSSIASMSHAGTVSGNTLNLTMTGIASQTITVKAFVNVEILEI